VQRRNTFLAASALLLTATCTFNPRVDPTQLDCKDDNGCPSGYRCVGVVGNNPGFCCNRPDAAACYAPADGAALDVRPTDAPAASPDGSNPQDLSSASEVRQAPDVNTADRPGTQVPDSSAPGLDAISDLAGTGGTMGTGDAGSTDAPVATGGVDAADAPASTGEQGLAAPEAPRPEWAGPRP